jgi:Serine aminopeptidase, S33
LTAVPAHSRWKNGAPLLAYVAAIHVGLAITWPSETCARSAELAAATNEASERIVNLPLSDGKLQRILIVSPQQPRAAIVMLPGGSGDVGIGRGGELRHNNNFVVRSRGLWVARGYAVLIPDAIDHANLRGARSAPQFAQLVMDLITYARSSLAPPAVLPVFLLGTSQGSIAAMNGAAHAAPGTLAGVVLTESVSVMGSSHETVFDAGPERVKVPALVVANTDDRCNVAPPSMAPRIAAAMTSSPNVEVKTISGGETKSAKACGSRTPHGYYGIEDRVVDLISEWMQARL